ncbi:MAG: fumarylacetoacetate hydrolase family protein [Bacteroidota bacterium]
MSETTIQTAAKQLRQASASGQVCAPIRDLIGTNALDQAYSIQKINNQLRSAEGARQIGCKIGLTSEAVQKQLGVDQPDYGLLFDDMEVMHGAVIPWDQLMQPKAEAEIAFVMKENLPSASITTAELFSAIDYAVAAIEIVGSRIENWNIGIVDTIADNASASHFVLGHRPLPLTHLDLITSRMQLFKNTEKVSEGTGADCLGSPLTATMWLAKTMAKLGSPLQAGDIVLTGALGPMVAVEPGDSIRAVFDGLGEVSVRFGQ